MYDTYVYGQRIGIACPWSAYFVHIKKVRPSSSWGLESNLERVCVHPILGSPQDGYTIALSEHSAHVVYTAWYTFALRLSFTLVATRPPPGFE